jgi:putative PIN family toxin of toxin-antitoxin system
MATLKVVLDTNVILSGLAYPGGAPGKIMQAWRTGAIDVVLSDFILDELRRVLPRLQHRHGLNEQEMNDLVEILTFHAEIVIPVVVPEIGLREAQDLPVLGTLLSALEAHGADYLISGDQDLLELSSKFPIVAPAVFWQMHGV